MSSFLLGAAAGAVGSTAWLVYGQFTPAKPNTHGQFGVNNKFRPLHSKPDADGKYDNTLYLCSLTGPAPMQTNEVHTSPFGFKVESYLRFAGARHKTVPGTMAAGPRGQIPWFEHNGNAITDSTFMIDYVVHNGLARDLDAGLSAQQRADSEALRALVEDSFNPLGQFNMAVVSEPKTGLFVNTLRGLSVPEFFIPPMRRKLRTQAVKNFVMRGTARYTDREREILLERALTAVCVYLEQGEYALGGSKPTRVDAVVFGFLARFVFTGFTPAIARAICSKPVLVTYLKRVASCYFPELNLSYVEAVRDGKV